MKITILNDNVENKKIPIKIKGCIQVDGKTIENTTDYNNCRAVTDSKELKVFKVFGYGSSFDCIILTDNGNLFTAVFNDGFL